MKRTNTLILTSLIISSLAYSASRKDIHDIREAFGQLQYNIAHQQLNDVQKTLATIKKLSDSYMFIVTNDESLWSNYSLIENVLKGAQSNYIYALHDMDKAYRNNRDKDFIDKTLKPAVTQAKKIKDALEETFQAMMFKGPSKKVRQEITQRGSETHIQ